MYQNIIIVGHLGSDPEMRYTPSGIPVTTFSVAVNRRWTDGNGDPQEKTTWFRVTAWRKLAELCNEYLSKGRQVLVEGEIEASAWLDRRGEPHATLELRARHVRFLGRSGKANEASNSSAAPADPADEDIPF